MDDIRVLVENLKEQGLSNSQILQIFTTLQQWLEEYYPVLAEVSRKELQRIKGSIPK